MPSFLNNTFASFFNRILQFGHSGNNGTPTSTTAIQSGDGVATSVSLSDDVLQVQPQNDDSVGSLLCKNSGGSNILAVDTTNSKVLVGASQVASNTQFKEMGLYDFSPTAGYHYPLIANTMFIPTGATAFAGDNDWGNGDDPATTLDVSGLTAQENAVAVYWYLENDITLDSVRYMVTSDGSAGLNFHLFAYTLDTSSNHGDLSSGTVHASAFLVSTLTSIKTGTFTLDEADIDAGKVVVGFVENVTDTSDVSVSFQIQYHIR
jgi:hypothetical protein